MSAQAVAGNEPNPGSIFRCLNAHQQTAALKAGIDLDVFSAIARGNRSPEGIAGAVNASPRGIRILCDYLTISGLLLKDGAEYSLTPDAAMFLDRQSPAYMGTVSEFILNPAMTAPFANLAEVVRTGTTSLGPGGTVSHDNPVWVDFARQMAPMMFGAASEIAGMLAGEGEMRVLDIAAGHGIYGIMIAMQNPKARITALDWPNVLAVATENAAKFGVADRHSTLPGDAFETEYGGPYDLILVTNFFHHFDPPACESLMRKIRNALKPSGRCVTVEFVPNDDRVSPPMAAGFSLTMLATTPSGDAYTFAEYKAMFDGAGFASSECHPLKKAPESVIISRNK